VRLLSVYATMVIPTASPARTTNTKDTTISTALNQVGLPLEWTRIQRSRPNNNSKRRRTATANGTNDDAPRLLPHDDSSCRDANCGHNYSVGTTAGIYTKSTEIDETTAPSPTTTNRQRPQFWRGKVYFCLPDPDCDWFQGYFFPQSNSLPLSDDSTKSANDSLYFGILGQVLEMDDCLQCEAGGYRHVSLQFTPFPKAAAAAASQRISSFTISPITWTGSDMMVLRTVDTTDASSNRLCMEATTVSSGGEAHRLVRRLFGSLIARLRKVDAATAGATCAAADPPRRSPNTAADAATTAYHHQPSGDNQVEHDIAQFMPQVAVVMGTMQVEYTMPQLGE
jgi:hypothetical protein